jgi:hypothetical protein
LPTLRFVKRLREKKRFPEANQSDLGCPDLREKLFGAESAFAQSVQWRTCQDREVLITLTAFMKNSTSGRGCLQETCTKHKINY